MLLCAGAVITPEHRPADRMAQALLLATAPAAHAPPSPTRGPADGAAPPSLPPVLWSEIDTLEQRRILDALGQAAGNQSQAARLLGISRGTLLARLERYGVPRPRKR
ncbi:MAG: hypothetical protein EXR72_17160 [Myxococcales bacterium]|nr:hypothetical protein [Myxococcales bacterium]